MFKKTILLIAALAASTASAAEGVLEINQTCAVETGCFPSDSPGFPVTIWEPGSYVLTGNLSQNDPNAHAVFLYTSRISLDLNGFSITGPSFGNGIGRGITAAGTNGSFAGHATISNGMIRGFRDFGIQLGGAEAVRLERMKLNSNAGGGASLGQGATVLASHFDDNGNTAISVGEGSLVSGNVVTDTDSGFGIHGSGGSLLIRENTVTNTGSTGIMIQGSGRVDGNVVSDSGLWGIAASGDPGQSGESVTVVNNTVSGSGSAGIEARLNGVDGSLISGNRVYGGGADGIEGGDGAIIRENVAYGNTLTGISCSNGCSIIDNTSYDNVGSGIYANTGARISGNTIRANGDSGIDLSAGGRSMVLDNSVTSNSGFGLRLSDSSTTTYRGNMISGNGDTVTGGFNMGGNRCIGSLGTGTSCP